jgi:hypothetical protein
LLYVKLPLIFSFSSKSSLFSPPFTSIPALPLAEPEHRFLRKGETLGPNQSPAQAQSTMIMHPRAELTSAPALLNEGNGEEKQQAEEEEEEGGMGKG